MKKKQPDTPCLYCCEKHFTTAMALSYEFGYDEENYPYIVGELGAAQLHVYIEHPEIAKMIQDIRHLVQHGDIKKVNWVGACKVIREAIVNS